MTQGAIKGDKMVLKNRKYTVSITGMTHDGMGVARIDGFAVFVPGAITGEEAVIKVISVRRSFASARLEKIIRNSPCRVKPFCSVYRQCGGCSLQHMSYEAQLEFKQRQVRDSLERIGGLSISQISKVIGMDNPYNYRNKAQYPVGVSAGRVVTGFYANRSHEIIYGEECIIQKQNIELVRDTITDFLNRNHISVYNETNGTGLVRHIVIKTGFKTGQIMAIIVINGEDMARKQELAYELVSKISSVESIILNINTAGTNTILGTKNITVYGKPYIEDIIGGYTFRISPCSFFQVNPVQTEVLYKKALEFADLKGSETVADLYCGTGTISIYISKMAKRVYGIEESEQAVADARENARINSIKNTEFIAGKVETAAQQLFDSGIHPKAVILDPPRKGCSTSVLEAVCRENPSVIVYISCNPATLARDLKLITSKGFEITEVQPVDMFPHIYHVECVVGIQRKESMK